LQDEDMHTDDRPIGRALSRREVVALLGLSGVALLAGRAGGQPAPLCIARPQQTEGPFFVEERLNRSDIRTDPATGAVKAGVPLQLAFAVSRLDGGACTPLAGAQVDVWHCDALGAYSDTRGFGSDTVGQKFLRGYQVTDDAGAARFTTIYPGWYEGRTVHIHFKIRTRPAPGPGAEFTSQIYFDDGVTDRVHRQAPYASRGQGRVRNDRDGLFRSGGRQLLLPVTESGAGYAGTFAVALTSARRG
jgi:protocatechuate 3,4-dioxygenase beta subunit